MNVNDAMQAVIDDRYFYDVLESEQGIWEMVNLDAYPIECYDDDGWYIGILDADGNFHPQEI